MSEGRKQAISLRLSAGDIRRIKALADRLGARDSDVVRFAIKMMLHRMLPLCDQSVRGRGLVPVLADIGPEAVRHFELDVERLDAIVNKGVTDDERVEVEDITLLTMVSGQETYAKLSLRTLVPPSKSPVDGERRDDSPTGTFRRHLYGKYGYAAHGNGNGNGSGSGSGTGTDKRGGNGQSATGKSPAPTDRREARR